MAIPRRRTTLLRVRGFAVERSLYQYASYHPSAYSALRVTLVASFGVLLMVFSCGSFAVNR
jgi:hypothetical protein